MDIRIRRTILFIFMALLMVQGFPDHAGAQRGELAAVITEMRIARGQVEVRRAGAPEWDAVSPLLSLYAGDTMRATGNAWAVVLLSRGRGTAKVDAANSPFVVPGAPPSDTRLQKLRAMLEGILDFLSSSGRKSSQADLAVRGGPKPPVIVAPRNTRILPDALTFEWLGSQSAPHLVRITGPSGLVLERPDLTDGKFHYPPDAPPLTPGVRYAFQVLSTDHPVQQTWFELIDAGRAQGLRQHLIELEQSLGGTIPPNSLAAMKGAFLAREGLLHDARLALIAALTRDPAEPTLHLLLAHLYEKIGLPELAGRAYDEAQFLSTSSRKARVRPSR
jgi:hypothetical protein